MRFHIGAGSVLALTLFLAASEARAERWATTRAPSPPPATGSRPNIFVPFLTDGNSTIMSGQSVAPIIYSSPQVDDRSNPALFPVYNLPVAGSMAFGDRSNGAVLRALPLLRPR